MSESALTVLDTKQEVELGTLHASSAPGLLSAASEVATVLADVIDRQNLYTVIGKSQHVMVEGWTTLAMMLGCTPREVSNEPQPDGSYVATVELVRMRDGAVISRATSECGMDEPTWAGRPRYARRSMAATRATGKACRLAFSWIMVLAGYNATPLEEMPRPEAPPPPRDVTPPSSPADASGPLERRHASEIVQRARVSGEKAGVHGFQVINHVLNDLGFPTPPGGTKVTGMIDHLCKVVPAARLEPFLRGVDGYRLEPDEGEQPKGAF